MGRKGAFAMMKTPEYNVGVVLVMMAGVA